MGITYVVMVTVSTTLQYHEKDFTNVTQALIDKTSEVSAMMRTGVCRRLLALFHALCVNGALSIKMIVTSFLMADSLRSTCHDRLLNMYFCGGGGWNAVSCVAMKNNLECLVREADRIVLFLRCDHGSNNFIRQRAERWATL